MVMKNRTLNKMLGTLAGIGFSITQSVAEQITPAISNSADANKLITIGIWGGLLFAAFVVIASLLYIIYALYTISQHLTPSNEVSKTPVFSLTDAVPIEKEHEIMLDHNYDGIRELDNNLPPWWVYMFYGTIAFSVFYIWFYHFNGSGKLQEDEYKIELVEAEELAKLQANKVDENSVKLLTDKVKLENGHTTFIKYCVACHGKLGEGGVGPNLTDKFWIHGGDIKSMFKTIKYGVPTKGMIAWQTQLGPSQIQEVASYIKTLKDTNPPNGKAPQGEEYNGE
jgi:cytochrome c oxidase cbb3-type subunit 3